MCLATPPLKSLRRPINDEEEVTELWDNSNLNYLQPKNRHSHNLENQPSELDHDEVHFLSRKENSQGGSSNASPKISSFKVPPNPFKNETVLSDKELPDARDIKIHELLEEVKRSKCLLLLEKDAHSETEHDFEMRLELLLDQLKDVKTDLEVTKTALNNRNIISVEAEADRINGSIKRRNSDDVSKNDASSSTKSNGSATIVNTEDKIVLENKTSSSMLNSASSSNFILAKPRIPALKEAEKENLYETISTLKSSQTKIEKENEVLSKKLKEVSTLYSSLLTTSSELQRQNTEQIALKEKMEVRKEIEVKPIISIEKIEDFYPAPVAEFTEVNSAYLEQMTNADGSQLSMKSTECKIPSGNEYFVVQTRNTEFLSIPFDSLNDMLPGQILQLLISYKLELANVSRELEDSRNELNRVKRINVMNALPEPALRKPINPRVIQRPQSSKEPRGKYTEKEFKNEKIIKETRLSSSSISANANKFSSDMFKSTASLMRFKTGKRGPGSMVGSVAGSISSFLGGSHKDDGEEWDDGSQDGSIHSSVHGSIKDGRS